jgi:signal transduction histidine kinase
VRSIVEYLGYANLFVFSLVALVALREWRIGRGRAGVWAALAFVSLALVIDVGEALPEEPESTAAVVAERLLIATLVLFPYLLYRFTTAFVPPSRRLEQRLGLMTVVLVIWTFALPSIPDEGEPQSNLFRAYLVAFVAHWTILTLVSAFRLWRGARGEPTVARRRMLLLVAAALGITAALIVAAFGPEQGSGTSLATAIATTLSALAFLVGFAPPPILRLLWRRPEQERLQSALAGLMTATTQEEVAERVLPPMAAIVGARALSLRGADDRIIGEHGSIVEDVEDSNSTYTIEIPGGALTVWTSPFAPYFGREERALLETLGALAGLALDRTRLFAQERQARHALERADELKSHFVALAAHELRSPVASVHGLAQTLSRRSAELGADTIAQLHGNLAAQTERLRLLVEQLLDLSRLDAEAIDIEPVRFSVRRHLEELVASIAAERAEDIALEIPAELEAAADLAAFDRVVSNLLQNALRYGQPPIAVQASQTDRHFRLTVEDRGPGVPPEFVPELFERFTRSVESRGRAGTGLGLAIARSYAQAHRGDLRYESAEPHGARFQLVLPVRPSAPANG